MRTIYEGKNITSLTLDSEHKLLFAADANDHKIIKFNYDPVFLEDFNYTKPVQDDLYFKLGNVESVAFFNDSLYWAAGEQNATVVHGNHLGWVNSTQVVVREGLGKQMVVDQDEAYWLDQAGNLKSVDLDPMGTLFNDVMGAISDNNGGDWTTDWGDAITDGISSIIGDEGKDEADK